MLTIFFHFACASRRSTDYFAFIKGIVAHLGRGFPESPITPVLMAFRNYLG